MIISHKYNLIFFKVPKTSGTLFELGFSKYLNNNDISTSLGRFENLAKLSFSRNNSIRLTKLNLILVSILKYRNFKKKFYFIDHSKPEEVKTFMRSEYENYYKIMFIRHPWKAFKSKYFWHIDQKKRKPISFYDFYEKLFNRFINDLYKFYYLDNGEETFDFLINYENILTDFEFLSRKINLFKDMKKFYLEQKINVSDSENKKINESKIIIKNEKYEIIKRLYENTLKQNL